jgi:signal transduction histidine kinase
LYVARQIVEAHGGEIFLTASRPRGAEFVIRLPRSHARENSG